MSGPLVFCSCDDLPIQEDGDGVAVLCGKWIVCGHDDAHLVVVCEVSQQLEEPFGRRGVERPSRFVGKEDVLPAGQCSRNSDALPLATRDLAGVASAL